MYRNGGVPDRVVIFPQGLSTRSLNLLNNKDTRGCVAVENAYRGSLGGKPDGDSAADSIPCAGHYGYSFVKPHHNPLPYWLSGRSAIPAIDRCSAARALRSGVVLDSSQTKDLAS